MLYSVPSLRMAASFEVASFDLHVCRTTVAIETNFHHYIPRYVFFLKSYGYGNIQTSNEFLLIFTINTPYTPNIFTGDGLLPDIIDGDEYRKLSKPGKFLCQTTNPANISFILNTGSI